MSFLRDYLDHAAGDECPDQYNVMCAYGVLSATISRRAWLKHGKSNIFCNLYTLLVGDAGNGKSWAYDKAKVMMAELDLPISGDKETPEAMLRFMAGDENATKPIAPYGGGGYLQVYNSPKGIPEEVHPMNVLTNEFVDFIKTDDIGWINILNNLYDASVYSYKTKNQGSDWLQGPYFTLLGCLTTQVSNSMQKDQVINTGLARRVNFTFGERKWDNPVPLPVFTDDQELARVRCIEHCRKIMTVHGPFSLSPEAKSWYETWYCENLRAVPTRDPTVKGWFASKGTQILKFGMLTSLSERLDRVIDVEHFTTALEYLGQLEEDLHRIFGGVGKNDLTELAMNVFNHIVLLPMPVEYNKLKNAFFRMIPGGRDTDKALSEVLGYLMAQGKIKGANLGTLINGTPLPSPTAIYATPQVFEAWIDDQRSSGVVVERSRVTQNGLPLGPLDEADPLAPPELSLNGHSTAGAQAGSQSTVEIEPFLPPMVVKRPTN